MNVLLYTYYKGHKCASDTIKTSNKKALKLHWKNEWKYICGNSQVLNCPRDCLWELLARANTYRWRHIASSPQPKLFFIYCIYIYFYMYMFREGILTIYKELILGGEEHFIFLTPPECHNKSRAAQRLSPIFNCNIFDVNTCMKNIYLTILHLMDKYISVSLTKIAPLCVWIFHCTIYVYLG